MTAARTPPLRIFFAAAADVLTDHLPHGEGLIAHHLMDGLATRGHSVVACGRLAAYRKPPAYTVATIGGGGPLKSLAPIGYAALARRELRRRGGPAAFDVAHWLFPQGRDNMLDMLPQKLPLVIGPLVLSWPMDAAPMSIGRVVRHVAGPVFGRLHRRALRRAGRLLISVPEAASVTGAGDRDRTIVVPFGIDVTSFVVQSLPARPTILFIGRLDRHKGVRELLTAFSSVRDQIPDARLRFAGDGAQSAWLQRTITDHALGGAVELLGRVPHEEIGTLVGACSLLCLPSDGEPFGMAILEAMAGGRAVVASNRGGPRHLVDAHGGILVEPGNAPALAVALTRLLSDPERIGAMGISNRARVEREFSWSSVLDRVELAYADAIAGVR
jgi:L-malate glycosyltransferase